MGKSINHPTPTGVGILERSRASEARGFSCCPERGNEMKKQRNIEWVFTFPEKDRAEECLFYLMALTFKSVRTGELAQDYPKIEAARKAYGSLDHLNLYVTHIDEAQARRKAREGCFPECFNEPYAIWREGIDRIEVLRKSPAYALQVRITFRKGRIAADMLALLDKLGIPRGGWFTPRAVSALRNAFLERAWRPAEEFWWEHKGRLSASPVQVWGAFAEESLNILDRMRLEDPFAIAYFRRWEMLEVCLSGAENRARLVDLAIENLALESKACGWAFDYLKRKGSAIKESTRMEVAGRLRAALDRHPDNRILTALYGWSMRGVEGDLVELVSYRQALGDMSDHFLVSGDDTMALRYMNMLGKAGDRLSLRAVMENMVEDTVFEYYYMIWNMTYVCMNHLQDYELAARIAKKCLKLDIIDEEGVPDGEVLGLMYTVLEHMPDRKRAERLRYEICRELDELIEPE